MPWQKKNKRNSLPCIVKTSKQSRATKCWDVSDFGPAKRSDSTLLSTVP